MKRKPSYKQREQEAKRARAIKASLLAAATEKIERLWAVSNSPNSGFSAQERKAIADAGHHLRSIRGGWLVRR